MKSAILLFPLLGILIIGLSTSVLSGGPDMPGYAGEDPEVDLMTDAKEARPRLAAVLKGVTRSGAEIEMTERELRDIVLIGLARHEQGQRILAMSRGLSTQVEDGLLKVAVKIDFAEVLAGMSEEERKLFDESVGLSRLLDEQEVVIGLESAPGADRGVLAMDPGTTSAAVSTVKLPIVTFLDRMGKSRYEVESLFRFKIPGYRVDDVEPVERGLRARVRRI